MVAVDNAGRAGSEKRGSAFNGRVERCNRSCDQFDSTGKLWIAYCHKSLACTVPIRPVSGDKMIVIKINLAQQSVASCTDTHPVIHSDSPQTQEWRSPFCPDPVPGIASCRVGVKTINPAACS